MFLCGDQFPCSEDNCFAWAKETDEAKRPVATFQPEKLTHEVINQPSNI